MKLSCVARGEAALRHGLQEQQNNKEEMKRNEKKAANPHFWKCAASGTPGSEVRAGSQAPPRPSPSCPCSSSASSSSSLRSEDSSGRGSAVTARRALLRLYVGNYVNTPLNNLHFYTQYHGAQIQHALRHHRDADPMGEVWTPGGDPPAGSRRGRSPRCGPRRRRARSGRPAWTPFASREGTRPGSPRGGRVSLLHHTGFVHFVGRAWGCLESLIVHPVP